MLVLTPDDGGPQHTESRVEACREVFDAELEIVVADAETTIGAQGPVSWKTPRIHDRRSSG